MFTNKDVEILKKETLYKGFFTIYGYQVRHKLFAGGVSPVLQREIFDRGHAVALLPYDPKLDKVVLLEQFRLGAVPTSQNPWLIELVAGMIEVGESVEDVAIREAQEEAGITVTQLEKIYSFLPSPGGCTERIDLFVGLVDSTQTGELCGLENEGEDIRVIVVSREEALEMLNSGKIDNASAIIGLQWLSLNYKALRCSGDLCQTNEK